MSTHSTLTWLTIREHKQGKPAGHCSIDVATDTMVDQCVRLSVCEGEPRGPQIDAQAHLAPDHAEIIGYALIEAARIVREKGYHDDPAWAAETIELTGWRPNQGDAA